MAAFKSLEGSVNFRDFAKPQVSDLSNAISTVYENHLLPKRIVCPHRRKKAR